MTEGIGHVGLWVIRSVVTLGLALFVAPHSFLKAPINRASVVAGSGRTLSRLHADVNGPDTVRHVVVWVLRTLITLGRSLILYQFLVIKRLLNAVVIVPV